MNGTFQFCYSALLSVALQFQWRHQVAVSPMLYKVWISKVTTYSDLGWFTNYQWQSGFITLSLINWIWIRIKFEEESFKINAEIFLFKYGSTKHSCTEWM